MEKEATIQSVSRHSLYNNASVTLSMTDLNIFFYDSDVNVCVHSPYFYKNEFYKSE